MTLSSDGKEIAARQDRSGMNRHRLHDDHCRPAERALLVVAYVALVRQAAFGHVGGMRAENDAVPQRMARELGRVKKAWETVSTPAPPCLAAKAVTGEETVEFALLWRLAGEDLDIGGHARHAHGDVFLRLDGDVADLRQVDRASANIGLVRGSWPKRTSIRVDGFQALLVRSLHFLEKRMAMTAPSCERRIRTESRKDSGPASNRRH